ncbi:MAG: hypothetical protein ACRDHI_14060 [Actinomycetota bacterium]
MDDFWHAVAMLRLDRPLGLAELGSCFSGGKAAEGLVGFRRGRLLATTCGYGLDGASEAMARIWMPWRGKRFSAHAAEGVNLFTPGGRRVIRAIFPSYRGITDVDEGSSAFRFATGVGPSATHAGTEVLRLDYRGVGENPSLLVRSTLDELVQIEHGLYLGQALLWRKGRPSRVAWFSLEEIASP